jgi:hypothetical protein
MIVFKHAHLNTASSRLRSGHSNGVLFEIKQAHVDLKIPKSESEK